MPASVVSVFAVAVILFAALSSWFDRRQISGPTAFTALGAALGVLGTLDAAPPPGPSAAAVQALTQTTLALILFHDAAQVRPRELGRDAGLCGRLLLLGLPLTVLAGLTAAGLLFPTASAWAWLFVAAALAPTDAGLGAATVLNPVVPARIRRVLNIESGLNDGLVTPVVLLAVTAMARPEVPAEARLLTAGRELALGVLVGVAAGTGAGMLLRLARRRGLAVPGTEPLAGLAVPLLAYYGATAMGGNGFVAAFVAGVGFAAALGTAAPDTAPDTAAPDAEARNADAGGDAAIRITEPVSTVLEFAVWALFGALAVPQLGPHLTWPGVAFAVGSLTLLRAAPVALALAGSGLRRPTVLFIAWFGPRGLASVIFVLIAVQALPADSGVGSMLATVELTVLLSVVLHGVTAGPGARRYGAWAALRRPAAELAG